MKVLMCSDKNVYCNRPGGPENQFFTEKNLEKLYSLFDEVVWNETGRQFTKEELIENVKDCDAVITCWGSNMFDEEIIKHAPKLKIIAHLAGSVSYIVNEDTYKRGIAVIGANDLQFAESVAECALLYALTILRNMQVAIPAFRKDKGKAWGTTKIPCRGLFDRNVGIVSFGAIGEYLAGILQPFHCNIKVYSRSISEEKLKKYNMTQASLEEIFSTCDVISLHTAWNKHTENMISRELMMSMKPGAVLVNTARGKIIDEPALVEVFKERKDIYAALEVFWQEPLPEGHPLYDLENVMVMDHRGGPTHDRYAYIASDIMDYVYDYLTKGVLPEKGVITCDRAVSMTIS